MKSVDLTNRSNRLVQHPIANQINEVLHDGFDNSCINYLPVKNLRNCLKNVSLAQFKQAVKYLVKHHYVKMEKYRGQELITLN